jgi:uncharacterized protein (DUF305 family)
MKLISDSRRVLAFVCAALTAVSLAGCTKKDDSRTAAENPPATSTSTGASSGTPASPAPADAPYDLQFIDTMISHHQGGIAMAELAAQKAARPEIKAFGSAMAADQKVEIAQMRFMRNEWYAASPPAVNLGLPGMESHDGNIDHMTSLSGPDFDRMFIDMMISHHEGAVAMARDALTRGEHHELKSLAQQIIDKQESEIRKMKGWRTEG